MATGRKPVRSTGSRGDALTAERKRLVQSKIFEVQAALVSGVDESQLSKCADWLQPQHYNEVLEERSVQGKCAFPCCQKPVHLPSRSGAHRIRYHQRDIVASEEDVYCSDFCRDRSMSFMRGLSEDTVASRPAARALVATNLPSDLDGLLDIFDSRLVLSETAGTQTGEVPANSTAGTDAAEAAQSTPTVGAAAQPEGKRKFKPLKMRQPVQKHVALSSSTALQLQQLRSNKPTSSLLQQETITVGRLDVGKETTPAQVEPGAKEAPASAPATPQARTAPKAAPKPASSSSRPGTVQIKERIDAKPVAMPNSREESKLASDQVVSINDLLQNQSTLNAGAIEGHQPSYNVDLAFQVVPKDEAQTGALSEPRDEANEQQEETDEQQDTMVDRGGDGDDDDGEAESDEDSPFDRHGNLRGGTSLSAMSAQQLETPFQQLWMTLTDLVDPDLLPVMHGKEQLQQKKAAAAASAVPQAVTHEGDTNEAEGLGNIDDRRRRKLFMVEMLERHVATLDNKMQLNDLLDWAIRADLLARVKAVFPLLRVSGPPPALSTEQWQLIVLVVMNSIAADLPLDSATAVEQRIAEYFSGEKIHGSEESKTQLSRFAAARASAKKGRFPGVTMDEFRLLSTVFDGDEEDEEES